MEDELKCSKLRVSELEKALKNLEEEKRKIKLHLDEFISENANFKDQVRCNLTFNCMSSLLPLLVHALTVLSAFGAFYLLKGIFSLSLLDFAKLKLVKL